MSDIPKQLADIASALRQGETPPSETVRVLLSWFGAQRRRYSIVESIRRSLDQLGIQTNPDFELTYIDAPIRFVLRAEEQKTAQTSRTDFQAQPIPPAETTPTEIIPFPDPTYRVGMLPSANRTPLSVKPMANLQEAITLMLRHDYSQLPVMETEREVKGIVSWTSIGSRLALGVKCAFIRDCMHPAQIISHDTSLFTAIETIVRNDYVLIRHADNRIGGIVTTADLSLQFRQLAEPFLLLGEIENHIRRLIEGKFSKEELGAVRDPSDDEREVGDVSDLTFGEYIRLLEEPSIWEKLNLRLDRVIFVKALDDVRQIRNDVMHFDPDPIPPEEITKLRDFAGMMQVLRQAGAV
jgi:CBS domain-containing protein